MVTTIVALASGELDEEVLAGWIRLNTARRKQVPNRRGRIHPDLGDRDDMDSGVQGDAIVAKLKALRFKLELTF